MCTQFPQNSSSVLRGSVLSWDFSLISHTVDRALRLPVLLCFIHSCELGDYGAHCDLKTYQIVLLLAM